MIVICVANTFQPLKKRGVLAMSKNINEIKRNRDDFEIMDSFEYEDPRSYNDGGIPYT